MWFLSKGGKTYSENTTKETSEFLQSLLELLSMFSIKILYTRWYRINNWNQLYQFYIVVAYEFEDQMLREFITVFFKAVVFHNVGLSWNIYSKEQPNFYLRRTLLLEFIIGLGTILQIFKFSRRLLWGFLLLHDTPGMKLCVILRHITSCMRRVMTLQVVEV